MKRWLCNHRVVEDIHGPKVYTFTFLFVLSTAGCPVLLFFSYFFQASYIFLYFEQISFIFLYFEEMLKINPWKKCFYRNLQYLTMSFWGPSGTKKKIGKNVDPSHGRGAVAVRLLHNVCSSIYVRFTRRQPRDSCTGAVQLSQEPTIILSYNFSCLKDHLKSCVARRIRAQLLCSASTGIVRCYLRHVSRLRAYNFLNLS